MLWDMSGRPSLLQTRSCREVLEGSRVRTLSLFQSEPPHFRGAGGQSVSERYAAAEVRRATVQETLRLGHPRYLGLTEMTGMLVVDPSEQMR